MTMDHLKPVQWTDALSVGVKLIDNEHMLLFSIYNDLVAALRTDQPLMLAKRAVEDLAGYATFHFAHEEELMKAFSYPEFDAHLREHEKLIGRLMEIDQNLGRNKANITNVVEFANALVGGHVMRADVKLAGFLKTRMPNGYQPFDVTLDDGHGSAS
jgi:hemerythrin-like metal-binding protein